MIDKTYASVADGDGPDRRVAPGDVAIDLAQSSPVIVLRREADTVMDYMNDHGDRMDRHLLDYPGNHLTGATEGDTVYRCVFVPNDVKSDEWRTYDYPETRLARVPAENSDDTVYRVQHSATIRVLSRLIDAADDASVSADPEAVKELLGDAGIDPELIDAAEEHAFWQSPGDFSTGVRRIPDDL